MGNIKKINIENGTFYFLNHMINIQNFNSGLLKLDKTSYKNNDIYYMEYITVKNIGDYESIHSVYPLYLGNIEEKNGNKYLVFASTDKNKKVLEKYTEHWDGIKSQTNTKDNKPGEYFYLFYFIYLFYNISTTREYPKSKIKKKKN